MLFRELGSTGLIISAVGFGGIPVQRVNQEEATAVIHRAEDLGVNFIDTARRYGLSEVYIGNALKGRRDKWIIASKSMERTREGMFREIETSLINLQTDYIDLYQLHNVKEMSVYDQVVGEGGALEGLMEAKKAGKIGHIGITAHSLDTLKVAIESGLFETIMYPYNIVENQAEELFKRARELNIGTIAMKPMAGGALEEGRLAIKYILQNENITVVIPGMANIKEVEENVSSALDFSSLTVEEEKKCREIGEKLGETFCRRCGYCAPCPQGIDIPFSFIVKSYNDNYDLKDWALGTYNSMKAHASDCKECGLCEKRCPYSLPIRRMLKDVNTSFGF